MLRLRGSLYAWVVLQKDERIFSGNDKLCLFVDIREDWLELDTVIQLSVGSEIDYLVTFCGQVEKRAYEKGANVAMRF